LSFADTYLVTDKLATYSEAEVDAAEAQLGVHFPVGYKDFVTKLGKGEYCGFVWMYGPAEIVADRASRRAELTEYAHLWEDGFDVLGEDRLRECIVIGASIDADLIVFHPDAPDALYELPRHDSTIYHIGTSAEEAMAWYRRERLKIGLNYFDSRIDRQGEALPVYLNLSLNEFRDWLRALGGYDHLDEKLNTNPGVSLSTYLLLKGNLSRVAAELSEVTAFYKSFSGYVSASRDGIGRVSAQVAYDVDKGNDTVRQVVEYLRSKAA
jgi:hypothetical protein